MKMTTILIGLNDKDTKKQEIKTSEARAIVARVFAAHTEGATISDAVGIYTHEDGAQVQEKSIRVEIFNGEDAAMLDAIIEIKTALNQESVIKCDANMQVNFI